MNLTRKDEDIILDFFDGSGTTAQLNQQDGSNRKFILVQIPEAPTGGQGYPPIADITKERVRRVIQKIQPRNTRTARIEEEPGPSQFIL